MLSYHPAFDKRERCLSPRKENRLSRPKTANKVRIIGGKWRGRNISFPDVPGLRPTGDRMRETLFNWLAPVIPGARCLDLFAGSGALGFEALSRGAASCVFVEQHATVAAQLRETARVLDAATAEIVCMDMRQWLATQSAPFDVVFLDPPFAEPSYQAAVVLPALMVSGRIAPNAWCYVEQPVGVMAPALSSWRMHRELVAGAARCMLLQQEAS